MWWPGWCNRRHLKGDTGQSHCGGANTKTGMGEINFLLATTMVSTHSNCTAVSNTSILSTVIYNRAIEGVRGGHVGPVDHGAMSMTCDGLTTNGTHVERCRACTSTCRTNPNVAAGIVNQQRRIRINYSFSNQNLKYQSARFD